MNSIPSVDHNPNALGSASNYGADVCLASGHLCMQTCVLFPILSFRASSSTELYGRHCGTQRVPITIGLWNGWHRESWIIKQIVFLIYFHSWITDMLYGLFYSQILEHLCDNKNFLLPLTSMARNFGSFFVLKF